MKNSFRYLHIWYEFEFADFLLKKSVIIFIDI